MLLHLLCANIFLKDCFGELRVDFLQCLVGRVDDRRTVGLLYFPQHRSDCVGVLLVGEMCDGLDRLDLNVAFRPLQHRQDLADDFLVAKFAKRPHDDRIGLGVGTQHLDQLGHRFGAANLRQCVNCALAYPPVRVIGCFHQRIDGTLVFGRIQDFDRGTANIFIFVLDELQYRIHHLRPTDFRQRIAGSRTYPPVVVLDRRQQILDGIRIADFVQNLDGCPPRIFVLILQRRYQVLDRVGVIDFYQYIHGLVLHIQVGVLQ